MAACIAISEGMPAATKTMSRTGIKIIPSSNPKIPHSSLSILAYLPN